MDILKNILSVLKSTRFTTFYWNSGIMFAMGFIDLLIQSLTDFNLPNFITVILALILPQITKAISNYKRGVPMGFIKTKK